MCVYNLDMITNLVTRRYCLYALTTATTYPSVLTNLVSGELPQLISNSVAASSLLVLEPDLLYAKAVEVVIRIQKASSSLIQRHLKIGYKAALRLLDDMERSGVVSALNSAGKRFVLIPNGPSFQRGQLR